MKKRLHFLGMAAALSLALVGCGDNSEEKSNAKSESKANTEESTKAKEQTITYLNEKYTLPANSDAIVTASLEAMEDAALLGFKPIGAVTIAGELPSYLADDLAGAQSIGEKMQPNYETLLSLKPDVILGSSKFQPDVAEQMNKIAPMIPVSHIATNWEENLKLAAELTGKQDKAEEILKQYSEDVKEIKETISKDLTDKKVVMLRIRVGNMYLYPKDVYFNPVLYSDLGLAVPAEVEAAKAQEAISLEKLAEMNPDYVFLQFEESENAEQPKALEELQSNPIWKTIQAQTDGHVFVNSVDPLAQGGTAWSKIAFLDAVKENLAN